MRVVEIERKEFEVEEKTLNEFLTERGSKALPDDVPGYVIEDKNGYKTWIDNVLFKQRYAPIDNFVERMMLERNELKSKMEKLQAFTDSKTFEDLQNTQKRLLYYQLHSMSEYWITLNQRIEFETDGKVTQSK